jgi:hypothetical protein
VQGEYGCMHCKPLNAVILCVSFCHLQSYLCGCHSEMDITMWHHGRFCCILCYVLLLGMTDSQEVFDFPTGTSACVSCNPGTYTSVNGSIDCLECSAGTYAPSYGSSSCIDCPINSYRNITMKPANACWPCPPGYEAPTNGSTSCNRCLAGTSNPYHGSYCLPCGAGYYADEEGMIQCKPCMAGTFSNKTAAKSASQCEPCPQGTFAFQTDVGANSDAVCKSCPLGTYSSALNATSDTTCIKCKAGKLHFMELMARRPTFHFLRNFTQYKLYT